MGIRDRIIEAYRELSLARGFHNTTMDELAARTRISKRTLYRYFRSKEEVIEATLDEFMADAGREVENILATEENPPTIMASVIKYFTSHGQFIITQQGLDDLRRHYPHLWQKIEKFRAERARSGIEVLMRKGGTAFWDVDPRIVTAVIMASFQAVLTPDFILKNGFTFEEAAKQLSKMLMGAFSSSLMKAD